MHSKHQTLQNLSHRFKRCVLLYFHASFFVVIYFPSWCCRSQETNRNEKDQTAKGAVENNFRTNTPEKSQQCKQSTKYQKFWSKSYRFFCVILIEIAAGGKPSTRFPPGGLVELICMTKLTASIKRCKTSPIYNKNVYLYLFMLCFLFWYVLVLIVVVRKRHSRNGNDQTAKGVVENNFRTNTPEKS